MFDAAAFSGGRIFLDRLEGEMSHLAQMAAPNPVVSRC